MALVDRLVLPADVVLTPVAALPAALGRDLDAKPGDFALTRPRTRIPSSLVNAPTARLLELFRAPSTVVDAVLRYSSEQNEDPRQALDHAFPLLARFYEEGLLVPPESLLARPIEGSWQPGDRIGGFRVVEPAQVLLDTEVYLVRDAGARCAALKIARPGSEERVRESFEHEAAVLVRLDGRSAPRLLERGELAGRPFLATSWWAGVDAERAAAEARARGAAGWDDLAGLAVRIAAAYADLHERGVLQGDVHPGNVLVDAGGAVLLIDFGLAVLHGPAAAGAPLCRPARRGGVDLYLEPELARARRAGLPAPPVTAAGEQYAVAALLYFLLTGAHTHAFGLEKDDLLRQVAEEPPLAFATLFDGALESRVEHGLARLEPVLRRALAKETAARFPSLRALARELAAAAAGEEPAAAAPPSRKQEAGRLLAEVLDRLGLGGPLLAGGLAVPTASINHGAAGFAYALLRIARQRDDERLLALADLWSNRALQAVAAGTDEAFVSAPLELTAETYGTTSFHHTASGVWCVEALVAQARGDEGALRRAVAGYLAANRCPRRELDVSFGRAGNLLGCALLLDALPARLPGRSALRALGDELAAELWSAADLAVPLGAGSPVRRLGAAHGQAGILYALLRWSEHSWPAPPGLEQRLAELAAAATPAGRGLRWPCEIAAERRNGGLSAGWCNGAAGFVPLWLLAHRRLGGGHFAALAERAAWTAYEAPRGGGDLCCGLGGRAYALLALHRHSGERAWRDRALLLAERAAVSIRAQALRRDSLYRGEVGVALLAADLAHPEQSGMPLYEPEGWPVPA